ncbi:transposable element Tc1 transposase [Trichonephila clavipes]|nr:transposable element Tc1 transposase [Trichonephila clavipes]
MLATGRRSILVMNNRRSLDQGIRTINETSVRGVATCWINKEAEDPSKSFLSQSDGHRHNTHKINLGQIILQSAQYAYPYMDAIFRSHGTEIYYLQLPFKKTTDITLPVSSRSTVSPNFLFISDSAQLHRTVEISNKPQSETILRMLWSGYSPDLNHIGHAWDALGRRIAQRTIPHRTVQKLKTALREEWVNMPQGFLDSLMQIMENRWKMCISVRGQHTSY